MIDLYELQKTIFENKKKRKFNTTNIGKEIIHLTSELGELATAYKESNQKVAKQINKRPAIIDAIGDLMVYCLGLYEMIGVDSEVILRLIVEDNKTRTHDSFFNEEKGK